jgi:hypothetical protein
MRVQAYNDLVESTEEAEAILRINSGGTCLRCGVGDDQIVHLPTGLFTLEDGQWFAKMLTVDA